VQGVGLFGVFFIVSSGPVTGRSLSAALLRAALACVVTSAVGIAGVTAQTLTSDLLRPVTGGFVSPDDSPLKRTDDPNDPYGTANRPKPLTMAPSRIGKIPTYNDNPAAFGASAAGYDSLNRKRKVAKLYPGQKKPAKSPGPGSAPPPDKVAPLTIPPSSLANKPPVAPAIAGNVIGQPFRKRLKIDDDPFGPTGVYAGSFLVKSAVELWGGYDSNPARFTTPRSSAFYTVSPELVATSDWSRHSVIVDLRGSFTGYDKTFPATDSLISPAPVNIDRTDFTGKVDGRLDVSKDTRINSELRLRVGADNPGSPNIQAGLSKYPLYTTVGGTLGAEQDFNRLRVSLNGTADRTTYQDSQLTNGESTTNDDRNFNQYGGVARVGYEVLPGLKPFGEVGIDTRKHDTLIDRSGFQRDSNGGYAKAGSTFEFTRLLTGEVAVGYGMRSYTDPRLEKLEGLLTSASLVWVATPLTTAKFIASSSLDETTLPGVPGVLTRTYTFEVDHDFRRWLTGIGKFTTGTLDYQGSGRLDHIYSLSGDLIYKLNREIWIKGEVRRDVLQSTVPGGSTASTVVMLGVRLQR
jgi:hypothetical protein